MRCSVLGGLNLIRGAVIIIMASLVSTSLTSVLATEGTIGQGINADVHAWMSNSNSRITFAITNYSDHKLTLKRANIPWLSAYSLEFIVVKTNSVDGKTSTIQMALPVIDPPVGDIVIPPHTTATGTLNLAPLFRTLEKESMTNDVLIRWTYVMRQQRLSKTFSGKILIPKGVTH